MGSLTIPDLDEALQASLRERAARHGRSVEEEARGILRDALAPDAVPEENLYVAIRRIVEPFGGFELDLPPREFGRDPPDFSSPDYDR
ncbi:MAG: plasmid stabilization protein [Acetobacteraceae bacterium]|nr:plasmid stabilization protein [Acetobacteraceae bacterium]